MSRDRIAVIGDKASVMGFKVLGCEAVAVSDSEEARAALRRLVREDYAIVYVAENTAVDILDTINEYADQPSPAIVLIPGSQGSLGIGMEKIRRAAEKAVGVDILPGNEE
ncbi:MAG: V-type ATP synthase subunit F [Limnochordia bacterium]|jgi:V/A-type H+-transporting ATPase subunit F